MAHKFFLPCSFNGRNRDVEFYVGHPHPESHPINYQAKWLEENQGGIVSKEIMDSIKKIKEIADTEGVDFAELCTYTINLANGVEQTTNTKYDKLLIEVDKRENEKKKIAVAANSKK